MGPKEQVPEVCVVAGPWAGDALGYFCPYVAQHTIVDEATDMGMRRQELMYCVILFILFKKITAEPDLYCLDFCGKTRAWILLFCQEGPEN